MIGGAERLHDSPWLADIFNPRRSRSARGLCGVTAPPVALAEGSMGAAWGVAFSETTPDIGQQRTQMQLQTTCRDLDFISAGTANNEGLNGAPKNDSECAYHISLAAECSRTI